MYAHKMKRMALPKRRQNEDKKYELNGAPLFLPSPFSEEAAAEKRFIYLLEAHFHHKKLPISVLRIFNGGMGVSR